jgi:hypothetical protein
MTLPRGTAHHTLPSTAAAAAAAAALLLLLAGGDDPVWLQLQRFHFGHPDPAVAQQAAAVAELH